MTNNSQLEMESSTLDDVYYLQRLTRGVSPQNLYRDTHASSVILQAAPTPV